MASATNNVVNNSENSSSDSDSTVIIVVFVSLGCIFFLAFALFALCCFVKCRKKKKTSQEADNVRVDEHIKIKEDVVEGPFGGKAVVLTIEDDAHIEEETRKNDKFGREMHAKSADETVHVPVQVGTIKT